MRHHQWLIPRAETKNIKGARLTEADWLGGGEGGGGGGQRTRKEIMDLGITLWFITRPLSSESFRDMAVFE